MSKCNYILIHLLFFLLQYLYVYVNVCWRTCGRGYIPTINQRTRSHRLDHNFIQLRVYSFPSSKSSLMLCLQAEWSFHIKLPCWQTAVNTIMYLLWGRFDVPNVLAPHPSRYACSPSSPPPLKAWELGRKWANTPVQISVGKEGW